MSFLTEMLSSDAKISSKRTVGFAAFFMLICSWGADLKSRTRYWNVLCTFQ